MEKFFKGDTVKRIQNETYEDFCKSCKFYGVDPDQEFIVANTFYNGCLADFYGVPSPMGFDCTDFELVIDDDIFMSADEYYADQASVLSLTEKEEVKGEVGKASESQVGGTHYLEMGISPLTYTYETYGYLGLKASITTKVLKYIGRNKDNEVEDIEKAIHCLQLLLEKAKEIK